MEHSEHTYNLLDIETIPKMFLLPPSMGSNISSPATADGAEDKFDYALPAQHEIYTYELKLGISETLSLIHTHTGIKVINPNSAIYTIHAIVYVYVWLYRYC